MLKLDFILKKKKKKKKKKKQQQQRSLLPYLTAQPVDVTVI